MRLVEAQDDTTVEVIFLPIRLLGRLRYIGRAHHTAQMRKKQNFNMRTQ